MRRLRLSALLAVAVVGSGCAGSSSAQKQPSWRAGDSAKARATAPQRLVFAPEGEPVRRYNDPPIAEAPNSVVGDAIVGQIESLSGELGKPAPRADGRLFAAAADLASVTPNEGTVAYRLVEFALQRHGIIEPSPHLVVIRGDASDPAPILEQLALRLTAILAESDFARVGVGSSSRGPGDDVIILALQSSFIRTKPIPRALPDGGIAPITGVIDERYIEPHVYVTRDDGAVESLPLVRGSAGAFRSEIDCGRRSGKQQIEITASDETGSTVLANFPLWCRSAPPQTIAVERRDGDDGPVTNAEAAEARMLELINRDRERHGLGPLALEERVADVARAHSTDMIETGIVGHISPNTGSASDRARAADIKTAVVLENIARAYGLREAQDGLMNSPGHRANILSPQATHVGIGIELGKEVAGRRELFVTQMFIRIPAPIVRDQVVADVVDRVRRIRQLVVDAQLAPVAQAFAEALAAGVATNAAAARASEELNGTALAFSGVTTLATTVAHVSAFDATGALDNPKITHFAVGVAQGDHPEIGDGAIFIVVLFGHR